MNKYQLLKSQGKLYGTIKNAMALRAKRKEWNYLPAAVTFNRIAGMCKVNNKRRSKPTVVPLGSLLHFLSEVKNNNPKLREWSLGQTAAIISSPYSIREIGSNSNWHKKSTFQRGIFVQSYATCANFNLAVFHLHGEVYAFKAPRGWRWDVDSNGFLLRSYSNKKINYHPTADELIGGVKKLPKKAKENYCILQENDRKIKADTKAVKRAEKVGVMVCLTDSIRAGNCRAGSESFARNHGLDPTKHYSPNEVLALANGQTRFVALACTTALRRTIKELDRGYSELSDHYAWLQK